MVRNDGECQPHTLDLIDDASTIVLGPIIEENNEDVPPFFVRLNVNDMILHNVMLDS